MVSHYFYTNSPILWSASMPEISEKLICLIYPAPVIVSLCVLLSLGLKSSSGSQFWHFGRTRQRDILQTYTGQTKSHFWKGTWNESGVKWPSSASLRTINRSPLNLRTLKPCLPYTHVITRLLCLHVQHDAWVRSSPLCPLLLPWSCSRFLPASIAWSGVRLDLLAFAESVQE